MIRLMLAAALALAAGMAAADSRDVLRLEAKSSLCEGCDGPVTVTMRGAEGAAPRVELEVDGRLTVDDWYGLFICGEILDDIAFYAQRVAFFEGLAAGQFTAIAPIRLDEPRRFERLSRRLAQDRLDAALAALEEADCLQWVEYPDLPDLVIDAADDFFG